MLSYQHTFAFTYSLIALGWASKASFDPHKDPIYNSVAFSVGWMILQESLLI